MGDSLLSFAEGFDRVLLHPPLPEKNEKEQFPEEHRPEEAS